MLPFSLSVMQSLRLGFAIALIAVFQSSALAAQGDCPHLLSDPRVNTARMLVEAGRYGEGLSNLHPLVPDHADRIDALFLVGLAALGAAQIPDVGDSGRIGLLDEAVEAVLAILIDRPGLVRVGLELARAFCFKGDDELAREHFERMLAGKPPAAMAANVRCVLEAMQARRRWSAYFGATLAPDSNVNAASDDETIYILGLPFPPRYGIGSAVGVGCRAMGRRGTSVSAGQASAVSYGSRYSSQGTCGSGLRSDIALGPCGATLAGREDRQSQSARQRPSPLDGRAAVRQRAGRSA